MRGFLNRVGVALAALVCVAVVGFGAWHALPERVNAATVSAPLGPKVLRCTTACNIAGLRPGDTAIIYTLASTTRTSTTTPTADANLAFTNAPNGASYLIDVDLRWNQGGVTTNGIQAYISSLATTASPEFVCRTETNTTSANASETANGTGFATILTFTASAGGGLDRHITCTGRVTTFAGNASFEIAWAQAASIATATTIVNGSWLRITRVV